MMMKGVCMDISRVAANAFVYAQTQAQSQQTAAAKTVSNELSDKQIEIKAQSALLKSDNDLFGAIKTLERTLVAINSIVVSAQNGEVDEDTAGETIADKIAQTNYKNENLFRNYPLADGSTIDITERLKSDESLDEFAKTLEAITKETQNTLSEVKARIMGGTQELAKKAQASYEKSGLDTIDPTKIFASTNADYLKEQFSKLMR
jgi:ribosomal protein L9